MTQNIYDNQDVFSGYAKLSRSIDGLDGAPEWPVNGYQAEGKRVTDWLAKRVIKQHRTLGNYINILIKHGFVITHLEEWGPTAQQITDWPALDEEKERPEVGIFILYKFFSNRLSTGLPWKIVPCETPSLSIKGYLSKNQA